MHAPAAAAHLPVPCHTAKQDPLAVQPHVPTLLPVLLDAHQRQQGRHHYQGQQCDSRIGSCTARGLVGCHRLALQPSTSRSGCLGQRTEVRRQQGRPHQAWG